MKSKFSFLFLFMLAVQFAGAAIVSPFNRMQINDSASGSYKFVVSGHFHGASTNASTFPASVLLGNLDSINGTGAEFLMSLGDLFLDVNDQYLRNYGQSLFSKLRMPLLNAPGNHDLANGDIYSKMYGPTFFYFDKGSERFIVLNTELNNGSIGGEQLEMLRKASDVPAGIRNVFIFSHRPLWAENDERYKGLFMANTRSIVSGNFSGEIVPLLKKLRSKAEVYWMSGSTGGGPASFFYDRHPELDIVFMQSAIRDLSRDALLIVHVKDGRISMEGMSLTGQQVQDISSYGLDFWKGTKAPEEKFNFRMLPYLTLKMLKHAYFWLGLLAGSLICILIVFIFKRRRRRSGQA